MIRDLPFFHIIASFSEFPTPYEFSIASQQSRSFLRLQGGAEVPSGNGDVRGTRKKEEKERKTGVVKKTRCLHFSFF